jgi:sterol desaturase/sphingolipid hydroxylase (fatty acid hydroxylase superfamily)
MTVYVGPTIYILAILVVLAINAVAATYDAIWLAFPLVYFFAFSLNALMTYCWPTERFREKWPEYREAVILALVGLVANQMLFGPWSYEFPRAFAEAYYSQAYLEFISSLPVWVTLPLAVFLFEGVGYLIHRFSHQVGFIWDRVHSVHHEPETFGVALALRLSYGDYFLSTLIRGFVVQLVQIDSNIVATAMTLSVLGGAMAHSNTALRFGWANRIFVTPEVHLWHHSKISHVNFSFGLFNGFDRLGGTFYFPGSRPSDLGIKGISRVRTAWEANLMRQLHHGHDGT